MTPTSIAIAMIAMFARVPKPGLSLSGIHNNRTRVLIANVDHPIVISSLLEIPCARTDHGAFPISLWISSESPRPNMKSPKKRTAVRRGDRSHLVFAVHGVCGTVL